MASAANWRTDRRRALARPLLGRSGQIASAVGARWQRRGKGRCSRWALRCREVAQSAFGHSRSTTWRPMLAVLALQEALALALRPREAVLHRFTPGVAE